MRIFTLSVFAALLSAPAFAADPGTYRPGTPYSSTVATGSDVCDNQCNGDAQCRGWNYVKPNPRAAGICEFLSSVSAPISSQISISGESQSAAPFHSGLTAGQTNTVRVGSPVMREPVRVGEAPTGRRIVRQAPPKQIRTQNTSTRSIEDMSLTAQQNRYRQGLVGAPKSAPQPQGQRPAHSQRPMFRPILDAPSAQVTRGQMRASRPQIQQQPQAKPVQRQASRRMTGPRRIQGQQQGYAAPQFHNPQFPQQARQPMQQPRAQQPMPQRGQARPPIGQPIQAAGPASQPQRPARPLTPSQRLAQLTAQTQGAATAIPASGPIALNPQQARKSLFGKLNDDAAPTEALPTASAVPTQPVAEQPLGEVLAGGR